MIGSEGFDGDVEMHISFLVCVLGMIVMVPLHFLSVEHLRLQERYGMERGTEIAEVFGLISGWGFFLFWIGVWVSPQPRFTVPIFQNLSISIPVVDFSIPLLHSIMSLPLLVMGAWVAIEGVREVTLKVAETHRTEQIVTAGVYSIVRHPQYLGGLLAHGGISLLLSAGYSLLSTPLMVVLLYLISGKEEEELIREFGGEYEDYKKRVPMLVPRLRRR